MVGELRQEGRILPCFTAAGNMHTGDSGFSPLCPCLQMTVKEPHILMLGLQINFDK